MKVPVLRIKVKPLLKPWRRWLYVTGGEFEKGELYSLTDKKHEAANFMGDSLYRAQDYFFFYRMRMEVGEPE